ncbi:MAG: hypothetical protein ACOYXC_18735 [Candidatus Rifleibacteriota bacterium]
MKKFVSLVLAVLMMAVFTGCAGTSGGSADFTEAVATNEEVAAVESSLLLDRVMAAETLDATSAEVLASTLGSTGSMRYRNRLYRAENRGTGMGLSRGTGSCMVVAGDSSIQVGTEQAVVEKLESGAIKITRGNGSIIETPAPVAGEIGSFIVDGIEWQATFGAAAEDPLVTLRNTRSGMILRVSEGDDGSLTVVRDNSEVFAGRWSEDGSLDLSDNQGKKYRYRYGRTI